MDSLCRNGSSGPGGMKVMSPSGISTVVELSVAGKTCVTGLWSVYMSMQNGLSCYACCHVILSKVCVACYQLPMSVGAKFRFSSSFWWAWYDGVSTPFALSAGMSAAFMSPAITVYLSGAMWSLSN